MRGKRVQKGSWKVWRRWKLRPMAIALSLALIGYSLYQIWHTSDTYAREERIRQQMAQYKPVPVEEQAESKTEIVNQNVVDAKTVNPDVVGWLTVDGTRIDYPFVQAGDNDYYLHRDINETYSFAGTAFMDFRSDPTFSGLLSVVYGHNMRNGTMFSDVGRYNEAGYFNEHQTGWLYLPNATYQLEIVAYMRVSKNDEMLYRGAYSDDVEKQAFLDYMAQNALRYRDLSLTPRDSLIVLSTCTSNRKEQRNVVIARLIQMQ